MPSPSHPVWFITGASSGLGNAFARHALSKGWNVVATARDVSRIDALRNLAFDRVLTLPLDVTQPSQLKAAVQQTLQRFGRIDVLVNNAGYGLIGAVEETPESEWRAIMETNFFGALSAILAVLPSMRAQGSGAIVNVSSRAGISAFGGIGAYAATKFAIEGLSEALAEELKPLGIAVLIVEPGAFRTDFNAGALRRMTPLSQYETLLGPIREALDQANGRQPGDPDKAAYAITRALEVQDPPLRLALGSDCVAAIREHSDRLLKDLARWEQLSRSTDFQAR